MSDNKEVQMQRGATFVYHIQHYQSNTEAVVVHFNEGEALKLIGLDKADRIDLLGVSLHNPTVILIK